MAFIKAQMGNRLVPSFANATDEEITDLIRMHEDGIINLNECWNVGEERTVHLNSMSATGVGESHAAQDVTFVIMNGADFFTMKTGVSAAFVIGIKNCLSETGYINGTTTNIGGYENSDRRTWCDEVFREALPTEVKKWFSKFKYKAGDGNQADTATELENYFIIPSYGEIFGGYDDYVASGEDTNQLEYYANSSTHKIKTLGEGDNVSTTDYFLRSPSKSTTTSYNGVASNGSHSIFSASALKGITILGCIGNRIKSFSEATDEEITNYLRLHRQGNIDLTKYWHIGDKRTVHLNAMEAMEPFTYVDASPAQDIEFTIMHGPDAFDLSDSEGGGKNIFVVGMEDNIKRTSKALNTINTNVGGYAVTPRRTWCDEVFREALPTEVKKWFKKFKYKSSDGGGLDTSSILENYFTCFSVYEVFGKVGINWRIESEEDVFIDYFKMNGTFIKCTNYYWLRSPYIYSNNTTQFVVVPTNTSQFDKSNPTLNYSGGFRGFGCI